MRFISKGVLAMLTLGLLLFGMGCGPSGLPAGMSSDQVIQKGLLALEGQNEGVYQVKADLDLKGEVDGEKNDMKGVFMMKGQNKGDNAQVDFELDGTLNSDSADVKLSMIVIPEEGGFVKIDKVKLSIPDVEEMVDELLKDKIGKWYHLPFLSEEDVPTREQTMDLDYEAIKNNDHPFKKPEFKGIESFNGVQSYKFLVALDKEGLSEIMDADEAEEFLEVADVEAYVYVGVDPMIFTGASFKATFKDPELSGKADIEFFIDVKANVDIKKPSDYETFSEDDLTNLMMGGMMMDPGAMEMDFDEDMMMEDFDFEMPADIEGMPADLEDMELPTEEELAELEKMLESLPQ